jgi:hypothetical protein
MNPKGSYIISGRCGKEGQIRFVRPATIASWIQQVMQYAGNDMSIHKAHSLRAAASTWAIMNEHDINHVKKHTNWSNKSNIFEKYYFKPFNKFQESTKKFLIGWLEI